MSLTELSEQQQVSKTKIGSSDQTAVAGRSWRETMHLIVVIFKLHIVVLLVLAATGGAFLGAGGWPGASTLLLTWVTGGMAAAGASAINQYWERNSDGKMGRTNKRPLVTGEIKEPRWIPFIGLLLILVPSLAVFSFNPELTFFLLLGAFIYVVIYTFWLKPRTLLNVVIGGAAGSAAVLSGSAAAGYWNAPGALVLALILFLWSPFHFWSLALLYREEYATAEFPMLPTQTSPRAAAWFVMAHTIPTAMAGLLLGLLPYMGWVYIIPVLIVSLHLVWQNIKLVHDPSPRNARSMFLSSNMYLLVLLVAICVGSTLPF